MTQDTVKQGAQAGCPGSGCCGEEMSARTMPEKCMQMMGRRPSALFVVLVGVLLIALGALIVFQPQVLAWLAAAAVALMGVMLLAMAGVARRVGARPRGGTGD